MTLDTSKHKNIFIKILKDIYTDNSLGSLLGFKGGTAAYLFYGLDRFSVDLDFDLLEEEKEDYVFEKIEKIVSAYGQIKAKRKKHYTLFFELSYTNEGHNIRVEINRRHFNSHYEVKSYLGISMKVMVREDMSAHKLMAMYERMERTNRDIFDVHFFLNNDWPINKKLIEERANMSFEKFLSKCIEKLKKLPERSILSGMGELLNQSQKDWARAKLLPDTIFLLKLTLNNLKE